MAYHVQFVQFLQLSILCLIVPFLAYHVLRIYVKCRVFKGKYGLNVNRYIQDKILEESTEQNRKRVDFGTERNI